MVKLDGEFWRKWSKKYLGKERRMKSINKFIINEVASMLAQSVDWVRRVPAVMYVLAFPPFPENCLEDMELKLNVSIARWKVSLLETAVEEISVFTEERQRRSTEVVRSSEKMVSVVVPTKETVEYLRTLSTMLKGTRFKAKSFAVEKFMKMYKETGAVEYLPSYSVLIKLGKLRSRFEAHKYAEKLLTPEVKCRLLWHMYIMQEAFRKASELWEENALPYELPSCFHENERVLEAFASTCLEAEEATREEERPRVSVIEVEFLPISAIKTLKEEKGEESKED